MQKIAIIGLGLIGGSIALSIKKSRVAGREISASSVEPSRVVGIPHREETLKFALEGAIVDEGTLEHVKGVADADIIFICTPINLILPTIKEIAPGLKKGAIVTDVGSSKAEIVAQAEKLMPKGCYFVGGHPMAGKEKAKLESAEAALFVDKTWLLTKTSKTSKKALDEIRTLIETLGAKVIEIDPKTHDLVVAAISHMPLAVAVALVNAVADEEQKDLMAKCSATGFRDTTRIASGDPVLGIDMFTTNKKSVLKMLKAFKRSLSNIEKMVKEGNPEKIREELLRAKQFRDSIYG